LELMKRARSMGASDLLICVGAPPSVYVNARMTPLTSEPLGPDEAKALVTSLLDDGLRERLERDRDVDFSNGHRSYGRCRVNVHYQRGSLAAAVRFVADTVPHIDTLHLPAVAREFARYPRGLVIITGGTGSGKSTTLAAIIDEINRTCAAHVITLEDPIEYAFRNDRCLIEQREIGSDSPSFAQALRHVVRQKPDIVMVGEMRDLETIATAVTAAETGHLVLASLHTMSAAQTIERIVDVFPPAQQPQVRLQLASALRAVACQTLFPTADGSGLVPAVEVLINIPPIARAIRDGETHLIQAMIETGSAKGMQTLDQAILELLQSGMITREDAMSKAVDPERLERVMSRQETNQESRAVAAAAGAGSSRPWS